MKIKADVLRAEELIMHLKSEAFECYNKNFDATEQEMFDMSANIVECVTGTKSNNLYKISLKNHHI